MKLRSVEVVLLALLLAGLSILPVHTAPPPIQCALSSPVESQASVGSHTADAMWIEPSYVNIRFIVGTKFNVTVWANISQSSFVWQCVLRFDTTTLNVLRAGYTGLFGTSDFFKGHATIPGMLPVLNNTEGFAAHGESLLGSDTRPPGSGSLAWMEFQVVAPANETVLYVDPNAANSFYLTYDLVEFPVAGYSTRVLQPHGPKARFTVSPETAGVGQLMTFDASTSQPGWNGTSEMPIIKYGWDFGDGNKTVTTSPTVLHAYVSRGNYSVTLNVTDGNDVLDTASAVAVILNHDVAITSITPYRTVIGNRTTASINVTVQNQGDAQENLTITMSRDSTAFETQIMTISNGTSIILSFSLNTTGLQIGNYTVTAAFDQLAGETDAADNHLSTQVQVCILGDINGDGRVDMKDVSKVAAGFQTHSDDSKWAANGDLDENGVIDMKDISTIAKHFGEHYP